ncbi:hypothetical protein U27_06612 [Candidatus Vecturithrix granuli]|uniref:Uncharacterized protein n=1 Tax=Vecturithrix granuli TaxID=1499967 RepID=A0A081C4X2_VECG1|nr:hypothetical protein U27_06612 [Candidatus Vecturithrix granuli]
MRTQGQIGALNPPGVVFPNLMVLCGNQRSITLPPIRIVCPNREDRQFV